MGKLKLAVLGLNFGWKYVKVLQDTKIAEIVAVSATRDHVPGLDPGIAYYNDYKKLMQDLAGGLDGIIAALPNDLHLPAVEAAAKIGAHVLLEKPIASSIPEAEEIASIVASSGIKLLVGHHRRFSAKINCLKDVIDRGDLGRIIGANLIWAAKKPDDYFKSLWRVTEGVGGPLLINGIHFVDDLRYLLGPIKGVYAYATNESRGNPVEDTVAIVFVHNSGAIATVFLTDNSPGMRFYEANAQEDTRFHPSNYDSYFFFGEKASISFPSMEMLSYSPRHGEGWDKPFQKYSFPVEKLDPMVEEVKHFCDVISGMTEPRTNAADATVNLAVIEAIQRSAKESRMVEL